MGITNPGQEYFKDGSWGWNGTQWIKLGMVWGYHDYYLERVYIAVADAGTNSAAGAVVPAGEVWVVTTMLGRDLSSATTGLFLGVSLAGVDYTIDYVKSLIAGEAHIWGGQVVLPAGAKVSCALVGCAYADVLLFVFTGYKMKVT